MVLINQPFSFSNLDQYTDLLPPNYNFEIPKTLSNIARNNSKCVALQFPDGLLKFSIIIADCIRHYTGAETIILGDVVYGACNIDDQTAFSLGADFLVHYGHSCLIPITECRIKIMYVFVSIVFDIKHCVKMVEKVAWELCKEDTKSAKETVNSHGCNSSKNHTKEEFNKCCNKDLNVAVECCLNMQNFEILPTDDKISAFIAENFAIIGTIQFNNAIYQVANIFNIQIPRIKPLSSGELLGCTSPRISKPIVIYISDGRFHLESAMIQNPSSLFYKYCPFTKTMSREFYDYQRLLIIRNAEKKKAMRCTKIGVILSTLGRQGNMKIFNNVVRFLQEKNMKVYRIALKEINEKVLDYYDKMECFVQIGCPRLSIDWGSNYKKPLLNAYEVFNELDEYIMDYYGREDNNVWNNY